MGNHSKRRVNSLASWNRGKGAAIEWIRQHVAHVGTDCLIWPFARNDMTGYGSFGYLRKQHYAHRYMCELVHGAPPSPDHQAAHTCGRGHDGCVHPRHLEWKTVRDNLLDRREHGTVRANTNGWTGVLTEVQVECIRALKGVLPQHKIAEAFGVKRPAIQYWHRHDRPKSVPGQSYSAQRRRLIKAAQPDRTG
jgi:hypothetical protein